LQSPAAFEIAQQHLHRGELDACRLLCEEILRGDSGHAEALHCIGLLLAKDGHAERAVAALEKAVAIRPEDAAWHHNLGVAYGLAERWQDAARTFATCLSLNPNHPAARASYSAALLECGHLEEAFTEAQQALRILPDYPFLHRTLGRIFAATGRLSEAAQAFQECLRLSPDNPKSLETAADFFRDSNQESLAAELFARLTALMPESPGAWSKSAGAYMRAGLLEPALSALRRAVSLDPANSQPHSILLYISLMDPAQSGAELLAAHLEWQPVCRAQAPPEPFSNSREPDRRIRLGILSGEFSSGSMRFFLQPILRNHDKASVELFAYSAQAAQDFETHRYSELFQNWRDVADLSDAEVEAAIRADQIDILVDVSGHLPGRRLSVFAARAAPVQIAYPRYPCTTGLDAMDYRITDEWVDPPVLTEHHYCEKLLRIPSGYLVYEPPDFAPPVSSLPALANGYVTFGFFLGPLRLNASVFDALAATVLKVRESRLLFQYAVGDFDRPGRLARQRIEDEMASRGIGSARLIFRGPLEPRDRLALFSRTDVALDGFPFSGQTNTCECLWMGVPVVSLAGARFAARVSAAILHRAGLGDWVAATEREYVEIAARKTSDLAALSELRHTLRNRFAASPVLDGARVTREIEAAYRTAWRTWCAQAAAAAGWPIPRPR
jgi:protein O-GlcNAc transferase